MNNNFVPPQIRIYSTDIANLYKRKHTRVIDDIKKTFVTRFACEDTGVITELFTPQYVKNNTNTLFYDMFVKDNAPFKDHPAVRGIFEEKQGRVIVYAMDENAISIIRSGLTIEENIALTNFINNTRNEAIAKESTAFTNRVERIYRKNVDNITFDSLSDEQKNRVLDTLDISKLSKNQFLQIHKRVYLDGYYHQSLGRFINHIKGIDHDESKIFDFVDAYESAPIEEPDPSVIKLQVQHENVADESQLFAPIQDDVPVEYKPPKKPKVKSQKQKNFEKICRMLKNEKFTEVSNSPYTWGTGYTATALGVSDNTLYYRLYKDGLLYNGKRSDLPNYDKTKADQHNHPTPDAILNKMISLQTIVSGSEIDGYNYSYKPIISGKGLSTLYKNYPPTDNKKKK